MQRGSCFAGCPLRSLPFGWCCASSDCCHRCSRCRYGLRMACVGLSAVTSQRPDDVAAARPHNPQSKLELRPRTQPRRALVHQAGLGVYGACGAQQFNPIQSNPIQHNSSTEMQQWRGGSTECGASPAPCSAAIVCSSGVAVAQCGGSPLRIGTAWRLYSHTPPAGRTLTLSAFPAFSRSCSK